MAFFMEECPNAYHQAGVKELYQQLLSTKVYYNRKTKSQVTYEKCRLCGDSRENVQHILSGCSALAQTKYQQRHNNAFKILFFEVLRSLDLITKVEPWFSQVTPKPLYENEHATAFWDVPLFADTTQVKANRIDATVIDKTSKQVRVIEMSCPWLEKRESNDFEKTTTYSQLRLELTNRHPEYKVNHSLRGRRLKEKGKGVLGARREGGGKRLPGNHCFRHPTY